MVAIKSDCDVDDDPEEDVDDDPEEEVDDDPDACCPSTAVVTV